MLDLNEQEYYELFEAFTNETVAELIMPFTVQHKMEDDRLILRFENNFINVQMKIDTTNAIIGTRYIFRLIHKDGDIEGMAMGRDD